uniref:Uncharacterized protein n=1 Tax=Aegilops tauschii subsp. strangulata TaxID=200361 RepID=A0A453IK02_AEGTS
LSSNADSSRLPSPPLVVGTVVLAQSKARSSPLSSPPPNAPEHASSLPPRLTIAPLFPDLPAVTAFSRRRRSQPPRRPDQDHDAAVSEHTDRDTGRSNLHRPSPVQSSPNTASTLHSTMKMSVLICCLWFVCHDNLVAPHYPLHCVIPCKTEFST